MFSAVLQVMGFLRILKSIYKAFAFLGADSSLVKIPLRLLHKAAKSLPHYTWGDPGANKHINRYFKSSSGSENVFRWCSGVTAMTRGQKYAQKMSRRSAAGKVGRVGGPNCLYFVLKMDSLPKNEPSG